MQLDNDQPSELIIWVGFAAGNHDNSFMFVFDKIDRDWKCIGRLLGSTPSLSKNTTNEYVDITTIWHGGGADIVLTTYKFANGRYGKSDSEKRKIQGQ